MILLSKYFFGNSFNSKESESITILLLYSFFMGIGLTFFFTVSISSFLVNFSGKTLSYAYLLSGLLSYITWLTHRVLSAKLKFSSLIIAILLFLFISVTLFTTISFFYKSTWFSLLLLAWVSPFLFVKNICFWGIASKLFNLSQSKKVFGVINTGEVISNIVGFFSVPFLVTVLRPEGLLVISVTGILIGMMIVLFMIRRYSEKLKVNRIFNETTLPDKAAIPTRKHNFLLLAIMFSAAPVFVFYFIDYMFLSLARNQFDSLELLATFMGYFLGAVSLVELFIKSVVFNKILSYYGLKAGLLCLPTLLLLATLLAISVGTWSGESYMFFSIIAFSKLLERSLSNGLHTPSTQIVYQPLPVSLRTAFQSNVEGISGVLGNITAGGTLLLLLTLNVSTLLLYCYLLLIVLVAWIMITRPLYESYKLKLKEALLLRRNLSGIRKLVFSNDIFKKGLSSKNSVVAKASDKLLKVVQSRTIFNKDKIPESKMVMNLEVAFRSNELTVSTGQNVLDELETLFSKSTSVEVRLKVLETYFAMGTDEAKTFLLDKLEYPEREIQLATIRILYSLNYNASHKDQFLIKQKVKGIIGTITWLNACLVDLAANEASDELVQSLKIETNEYFDALYMLLSFLYGYSTVHLIKTNLLDKSDTESHIYALEIVTNTFDKDIVPMISPWFDNLSLDKRMEKLSLFFPQQRLSLAMRAVNILYKEYSAITLWTKLNALKLLGEFYEHEEMRSEIVACLFHRDQLIKEMAFDILSHQPGYEIDSILLSQNTVKHEDARTTKTLYEKVLLLKEVPLFHISPEYKLVPLAKLLNFKAMIAGSNLSIKEDVIILLSGKIRFLKAQTECVVAQPLFTFIRGIYPAYDADHFLAEEDSTVLMGDKDYVLNCLLEDPNLSKRLLKYVSEQT